MSLQALQEIVGANRQRGLTASAFRRLERKCEVLQRIADATSPAIADAIDELITLAFEDYEHLQHSPFPDGS